MKKHFFNVLLCGLLVFPFMTAKAQSTVDAGQSTEGKDFWVTFLRADAYDGDDKPIKLSLTISAQKACSVVIENTYSKYSDTIVLGDGELRDVLLYTGTAKDGATVKDNVKCYSFHSESIDTTAVHVTSTENISLFASNWKTKSFDATNVLPTKALLDDYYIQSYPPSAHGGDTQQGTHFAIVAAEDNTIVDYCPTVPTEAIKAAQSKYAFSGGTGMTDEEIKLAQWKVGDTLTSPVLKAGQVWYVWTGTGGGDDFDLSGTHVMARNSKPIAVFQGAPHTNIPYKIRDRDHIYSQAMPTKYWGNTFAITASMTHQRDKIRIMALNDETEVRINGTLVHTFHFEGEESKRNDNVPSGAQVVQCVPRDKRTFEFEIGEKGVKCTDKDNKFDLSDPLIEGTSCFIETSCPVAVHMFMVSNTYDNTSKADPAMLWINPIEQVIEKITFATYNENNTHYFNVVTTKENVSTMMLDGTPLTGFTPVVGSEDAYYYTRQNITHGTHTLEGTEGFIAHVYGYGDKESYGYSAGGATKPLTQYITINGEIFTPDSKNTLCGEDTIKFACHPDYQYEKIVWNFGDGMTDTVSYEEAQVDSIVPHYYAESKTYEAYVLIFRESSNVCKGQNAVDSIPITVTIGRYQFTIGEPDIPCPEDGKDYIGKIPYTNAGNVDLHGDNVTIEFNDVAKADGFKDSELVITDTYFQISIPDEADPEKTYGIHLVIASDCGGADTTLTFKVNFDNDILIQRYGYLLGLKSSFMEGRTLSDFQWYRYPDGTKVEGQNTANLNFYDLPEGSVKPGDAFYVSFIIDKGTPNELHPEPSCPKAFDVDLNKPDFGNPEEMVITASYAWQGDLIYVNADWNGKTDIECYAQWIDASGNLYQNMKFDIPDGGCTIPVPAENGLYLLRVYTDGKNRSFKFIINH